MTFGEYLTAAMQAAGFPSNAALARASGVGEGSISRWRNNYELPRIPALRQLEPALKVPVLVLAVAADYFTWQEAGLDGPLETPKPIDADALLAKSTLTNEDRDLLAAELRRLRALHSSVERSKEQKGDGESPDRRRA